MTNPVAIVRNIERDERTLLPFLRGAVLLLFGVFAVVAFPVALVLWFRARREARLIREYTAREKAKFAAEQNPYRPLAVEVPAVALTSVQLIDPWKEYLCGEPHPDKCCTCGREYDGKWNWANSGTRWECGTCRFKRPAPTSVPSSGRRYLA